MADYETPGFFLLNSQQGPEAASGWRSLFAENLRLAPGGVDLAPLPGPPTPLLDEAGSFGGLDCHTGVAVAADGSFLVSDAARHLIYRVTGQDGLPCRALFFRAAEGPFAQDRFVYLPSANRLERWPQALGRDPIEFSEMEVVCETVWSENQARQMVRTLVQEPGGGASGLDCGDTRVGMGPFTRCAGPAPPAASPDAGSPEPAMDEWEGLYPASLPTPEVCQISWKPLPCLGRWGSAPRRFKEPRGLAISPGGRLYVADTKNHRIQIFDLRRLTLQAIWGKKAGPADAAADLPPGSCLPPPVPSQELGRPMPGAGPGEFSEPWDLAVNRQGDVYIADRGNQRVQKFDCRAREFLPIDGTVLSAHFFLVLYGPKAGERFVFIPARRRLEQWPRALGRDPRKIGEVSVVNHQVASLEEARSLLRAALDAVGARGLTREWEEAYPPALAASPQPEPGFEKPTHLALDAAGRLYVADIAKDYVKILNARGRVLGQARFVEEVADRFPSQPAPLLSCDRAASPAAAPSRFTSPRPGFSRTAGGAARRSCCGGAPAGAALTPIPAGPQTPDQARTGGPRATVGRLISGPLDSGIENCQWHKILADFSGDIPLGTSVSIWTYAAATNLSLEEIRQLAPEDWQTGQTNAGNFLILSPPGRFLWLKIEFRGNGIDSPVLERLSIHFPRLTYLQYLPAVYQADPVSRDFLERFLSLFEDTLGSIEDRIDNMAQLFDPDGVPAAPRDFLSWLAGWVGLEFIPGWSTETRRRLLHHAPELYRRRGTPGGLKRFLELALGVNVRILENFRVYRWLQAGFASLGEDSRLFGNCIVRRLQLDEHSNIGDFALVDTGDPVRDPFFAYAHKFSVFIQSASIRSPVVERVVRHLIDQEKPAHTQYDLVKVEPRFRVGVQATVGLDTQVGAYPRLVLNYCATLGGDALLNRDPLEAGPAMVQVGNNSRVGVRAVVG